jgi:hypothetical protein
MAIYGIDKVRGGAYSTINLDDSVKLLLIKEIQNASGLCFQCGIKGHFIKNCPSTQNNKGKKWTKDDENLLIQLYDTISVHDIAIKLGRSEGAILSRLERLGYEIK